MQIKAHKKIFTLVNEDKVERAKNGFLNGENARVGGVAEADGSYVPEELVAEYDKLGGKIMVGSDVVKTGSFHDFKTKKPHAKPKIVYTYNINGQVVDVPEGAEVPGIVNAARIMAANKAKPSAKKVAETEETEETGEEDTEESEEEEEEAPAPVAKKPAPKKKAPVKKAAPVKADEDEDEGDEEDD